MSTSVLSSVTIADFFSFFLCYSGWHTLPSHASTEACLTSWPNAQPQGRDQCSVAQHHQANLMMYVVCIHDGRPQLMRTSHCMQCVYTLHTPSGQPNGVARHNTSPFPGVAHQASCEAGFSAGMRRERVPPRKRKKAVVETSRAYFVHLVLQYSPHTLVNWI